MKVYGINLIFEEGQSTDEDSYSDTKYGDAALLESNGEYLLMDTGSNSTSRSLVDFLKSKGITELSVYISHIHPDHAGGLKAVYKNFNVKKIYLPDYTRIGTEYLTPNNYDIRVITNKLIKESTDIKEGLDDATGALNSLVTWLNKGDSFNIGSVSAKVIGPVGTHHPSDYSGTSAQKMSHYLNDCSLSTVFYCGSMRFLTTGDIEANEEGALVNTYGSNLWANVLKMPHHGLTTTSNTESFFAAVRPKYAFAENMGYDTTNSDGKTVWKNHNGIEIAQKYGIPYMVGTEGKAVIYDFSGNNVDFYRDDNNNGYADSGEKKTGWVSLCGTAQTSAGNNYTGNNIYYIDSNGNAVTGIQYIDGAVYYFGDTTSMEGGYYKASGSKYVYTGYRTYGNKLRFFNDPDWFGRMSMTVGFRDLPTDSGTFTFYFDENGFRKEGTKNWDIYYINGNYYAMNASGVVYTNNGKGGLKTYKSNGKTVYRYFGPTGIMATGMKKLNGATYYFNPTTGFRETGLKQIGDKFYYFGANGKMVKNKTVKVSGVKCKFNKSGALTSPKLAKPAKITVKAKKKRTNVVSWKKVKGASGYIVYRSTDKKQYTAIKTVSKPSTVSFTDKKATSKQTYYYKVCAYKKISSCKVPGKAIAAKRVKTK
jgi:beta-lactamase superfamily II metal-dependent hydrolase